MDLGWLGEDSIPGLVDNYLNNKMSRILTLPYMLLHQ